MSLRVLAVLAVAAVAGALLAGSAYGQQGGRGRGAAGGAGGGGGAGGFDPAQMRQRAMERMREALGATEEEWQVLGPRVQKVQELSAQVGGGGAMRMFMGRGGAGAAGGGRRPGAPETDRPLTAVQKATQELQAVLDGPDPKPAQIKEKLTALREAREKAKQELDVAQKELLEVITLRQEAQLVLMGLLD